MVTRIGASHAWATPLLSLLIALGALASVVTWIAGPSRGLLAAARRGFLPPALQRRRKNGVQAGILTVQGIIVSVLALLFVVVPDGQTAIVTLVDMAAALYLVMYVLMFAAAIRLRRTQPDVLRTYRTPAMRLVVGVVVIVLGVPPLIFVAVRKPSWDLRTEAEKTTADNVLVNPGPAAPVAGAGTPFASGPDGANTPN